MLSTGKRYLILGVGIWWMGCGKETTDPPDPPDPPAAVASVEVTAAATGAASLGETVQLTAVARDADGNAIGNKTFTWSSSEPTKATVSSNGLVTAVANGTARISATVDGVEGFVDFTVEQVATALAFLASPNDAEVGETLLPTIEVEARDALGNRAANFTDDVTVALDANPGSGTLSGTTIVAALAGAASFTDLSIDAAAAGYTLAASAVGLAAATSAPFEITPQPMTVTWTGTSGGNWSDGANWSGGTPPTSVDVVQITTDGTYTVTVDADVTIRDLTIGASTGTQTLSISASTLTVTGSFTLGANGLLAGNGTLDVAQATSSQVDGTVAPGSSPGILTVVGDLVLGSGSQLVFEIGGPTPGADHDRLLVTGDVTFDGTMSATLINAYAPAQGTRFGIMAYASGTGQFATVTVPSQLSVDMQGQSLDLEATASPAVVWDGISAGEFSCGLTGTDAQCWGSGSKGQLGNGQSGSGISSNLPVGVQGGLVFQEISAGSQHACGITDQGAAWCWGHNTWGQLGDNGTIDQSTPVAVADGHVFASISAGISHTCGLTTGGVAYCWGSNADGQFGDGNSGSTYNIIPKPTLAGGGASFVGVTAGAQYTCWWSQTGAASCSGRNFDGQIGSGTSQPKVFTPEAVAGGLSFASVSAGRASTCGLTTTGEAWCWGKNDSGALGDGTFTSSSVPVAVSGSITFARVTTGLGGNAHACGIATDGTGYCWGDNTLGAVGDGTTTNRNVPTALTGFVFTLLDAGAEYTCGVTDAAEAWCWGNGGPLGNGTFSGSDTPVQVVDPS